MKIVAWPTLHVEENGSSREIWTASHVGKALTASGPTAENAIYLLVRWLKASLDPKDQSAAPFDLVIFDPPAFPEDHVHSPEASALLRKKRLSKADQDFLLAEATPAWRVRGLPVPAPTSRELYPASADFVLERFNAGAPFSDAFVELPDGWEARVWTEA